MQAGQAPLDVACTAAGRQSSRKQEVQGLLRLGLVVGPSSRLSPAYTVPTAPHNSTLHSRVCMHMPLAPPAVLWEDSNWRVPPGHEHFQLRCIHCSRDNASHMFLATLLATAAASAPVLPN
jgi:hypothetical protein